MYEAASYYSSSHCFNLVNKIMHVDDLYMSTCVCEILMSTTAFWRQQTRWKTLSLCNFLL